MRKVCYNHLVPPPWGVGRDRRRLNEYQKQTERSANKELKVLFNEYEAVFMEFLTPRLYSDVLLNDDQYNLFHFDFVIWIIHRSQQPLTCLGEKRKTSRLRTVDHRLHRNLFQENHHPNERYRKSQ